LVNTIFPELLPIAYEEPEIPLPEPPPKPEPVRDLAAEIDDLKTRVGKLEKKGV